MSPRPSEGAADWRRLQLVEEIAPPGRWRRSVRRVRGRHPLRDPVGQGLLALAGSMSSGLTGIWLLTFDRPELALPAFGAAIVLFTFYVGLSARAIKRGKTVQYWEERQRLRFDLRREEGYRRLSLLAMDYVGQRERASSVEGIERVLERMVDEAFSVFGPHHDDLAVLLVHQAANHCMVVNSRFSPGSRWHDLRSGKRCYLKRNLEDRLSELAPHHPARLVSAFRGSLWLVVLHVSPMSSVEKDLLNQVARVFSLVADGWAPPTPVADTPGALLRAAGE